MADLRLPQPAELRPVNPFLAAADLFDPVINDWAQHPQAWAQHHDLFLWSRQVEILESIRDHHDTAVPSCHNAGKSFVASAAAAWWLESHPPGEAFVVTTAPTGAQVKAILWREINRLHTKLGLPGRVNLTEWYINGELVALGRKPNDYDPTSFQGIHAVYVLAIGDEACGLPKDLLDAMQSVTSNDTSRVLLIGNPDDPQSEFAKQTQLEAVNVIPISAFDTPNFTGEEVPEIVSKSLVSVGWVEGRKAAWGESSPVYTAKVKGEFPGDATDGVVLLSWASRCQELELAPAGDKELGLDPARGGGDDAVLWLRQGPKALQKWSWAYTPDPKDLAEKVLEVILETGASNIKIDADGLGWGLSGILDVWHEEGKHNCISIPVFGSGRAEDDEHFLNKRAEMWWMARELSRLQRWDLSAVDDDDVAEMCAPRWHTRNPRSRIQIEKKEDLKKRLGHSPDSADALILAFVEEYFEAQDFTQSVASFNVLAGR